MHDVGNLLVLLLQAPVIGLILFYLASSSTVNSTSITTCPLRSNPFANSGPVVSFDCQRVVELLNTPRGRQFVQRHGETPQQALQNAIEPNYGINAHTLILIM